MTPDKNPEMRRKSARMLVVYLSALIMLLSFSIGTLILVCLPLTEITGSTLQGIEILFFTLVILISSTLGGLVGGVVWTFLISFYLTKDEWKALNEPKGLVVPIISPILKKAEGMAYQWKLVREKKKIGAKSDTQ
jgi:hypothetical protein